MRIDRIILNNFRIYSGENMILFNDKKDKNVSLIAGKNGFGKTTFLTSLIWGMYGNLMAQVEDKYKRDIKDSGGYEQYLKTLLNKNVLNCHEEDNASSAKFSVEIHLLDVMIPSIPCKKVIVKRSYDYNKKKESLAILIDGHENNLTKDVGYDVFINDFILPREIAKFFFFDAEKIVTLAEAKSKVELRSLSKAYSEVLGIKKYEDLKLNLKTLLTKLWRDGVEDVSKEELQSLVDKDCEYHQLIELNQSKQTEIDEDIVAIKSRMDQLQEKLIREGNEMTLEELKELKSKREEYRCDLDIAKKALSGQMEMLPFVIAKSRFNSLVTQVKKEMKLRSGSLNKQSLKSEFDAFSKSFTKNIADIVDSEDLMIAIENKFDQLVALRLESIENVKTSEEVFLDFDDEVFRNILSIHTYFKESFITQFKTIVKNERDIRQALGRTTQKIKEGEARKTNPLAIKLREDKLELDEKLEVLVTNKQKLIEDLGGLKTEYSSNAKILSEYEKKFNIIETDQKKYKVTEKLLEKLNVLTNRIKEEKKFALQKSILLGLKRLMHKSDFVTNIDVRIEEDIMDIDLIDAHGKIIDKDGLSKGEQQLYATALLKALVDESGINFPVFIDSPLQKFDKQHSSNVIQQFYPSISEQVVLFPLLEKELSVAEYEQLKVNLNGVYLIENSSDGSSIEECQINDLYTKFNKQNHVHAN